MLGPFGITQPLVRPPSCAMTSRGSADWPSQAHQPKADAKGPSANVKDHCPPPNRGRFRDERPYAIIFPAPLSIHHPPGGKSTSTAGESHPLPTRRNSCAVGKEFSCRRETFLVPSRISSRRVEKFRSTGRDLAPIRVRPRRRWGEAGESARTEASDRGEIVI